MGLTTVQRYCAACDYYFSLKAEYTTQELKAFKKFNAKGLGRGPPL